MKKNKRTTLVSGHPCKELGSHHSHSQNDLKTKTEETENQQFLDPSENRGHRANCCSLNWGDRYVDIKKSQLTQQKPP